MIHSMMGVIPESVFPFPYIGDRLSVLNKFSERPVMAIVSPVRYCPVSAIMKSGVDQLPPELYTTDPY